MPSSLQSQTATHALPAVSPDLELVTSDSTCTDEITILKQMHTLKIYSDSPLSSSAEQLLKEGVSPHEIIFAPEVSSSVLSNATPDSRFATVDIAFGQPDVASIFESKRLQWIHITSAGYTRYDNAKFRETAKARGLSLTNSSTVYSGPCAEHVFSFMLAHSRRLPLALKSRCESGSTEWDNLRDAAVPLRNQRVVILGFGAIALKLLDLLRPFQMQIVGFRRRPKGNEGIPIVDEQSLPAALAVADHVINILPENRETVRFISKQRLAAMKPGAVFYNIGRGKTVDQEALLAALKAGRLDAAWLDVTDPEPLPPDHPLLAVPNCYITPHTAGGHRNESESLVRHFLDNFQRYLKNDPLLDRVV